VTNINNKKEGSMRKETPKNKKKEVKERAERATAVIYLRVSSVGQPSRMPTG